MFIPRSVRGAVKTKLVFSYETGNKKLMSSVKRYCNSNGYRCEGDTRLTPINGLYFYSQEFVEDYGGE